MAADGRPVILGADRVPDDLRDLPAGFLVGLHGAKGHFVAASILAE